MALELHRAVAKKLIDDPSAVLEVVPKNLERLRKNVQGRVAESWLNEWSNLAEERNIGGLIDVMLGTDSRSIAMRQTSPFNGVLTTEERLDAIYRASASSEQDRAMTREMWAEKMRGLQQQAREELEASADGHDA